MRRATLLVIFLALLTLLLVPAMAQDSGSVRIRVAHFSPDTPAVDVFVNGDAAITGLAFPTVTDWVELPAGTYEVAVAPAGAGIGAAAIGPANFDLPAGGWITVAAVGSLGRGTLKPAVLVEDYARLDAGQSRVTVFHGIEGVPPVDVLANGATAVQVLGFPGSLGSNDGKFTVTVPAGVYDFRVIVTRQLATSPDTPTQVLFDLPDTRIDPDVSYFVAAVGTPAEPQLVIVPTMMPGASTQSLVDLALGNSRLSTLVAAVQAAGLVDELANGGPYTVFAPNNSAFEAAFAALGVTAEDVLSNSELLTQILLYHVVPGGLSAEALAAQGSVTTLEGSAITAEAASFGALLNGSVQIIRPDARATNGVLHTVDSVLLPPAIAQIAAARAEAGPAILDVAGANGFNTLVAAVRAAGLSSVLNDPFAGPFTVFAPTDEAFAAALAALGLSAEELLANTDLLTQVLQYHVVSGRLPLGELVNAESVTTLQGEDIALSVEGTLELNGTTKVLTANVPASNGIIHAIDAVLLPPSVIENAAKPTIVDVAGANGFNTLVAAVRAAGLSDVLGNPFAGPFTVFAPTDEAFAAALAALNVSPAELLANTDLLTQVLQYHVVSGRLPLGELVNAESVTTLQGEDIALSVEGTLELNGTTKVLTANVPASNGIIHAIDAVLLPPSVAGMMMAPAEAEAPAEPEQTTVGAVPQADTVLDIIAGDSRLSTLLAAAVAIDAPSALAGAGQVTILAPNDSAFAAALESLGLTVQDVVGQPDLLRQILFYHIVPGGYSVDELIAAGRLPTLEGNALDFRASSKTDFGAIINRFARVLRPDRMAADGSYVHTINAVLLPPSVAQALGVTQDPGPTIAEVAAENGSFNTLVAALGAAGLAGTFNDPFAGPFTVFAPTDDAFAAALAALGLSAEELLGNTELLTSVLKYHVVSGVVPAEEVVTLEKATTLQGADIAIAVRDGNVVLNDSVNVVLTNVQASNGIIHVIDAVLLPPSE